MPFICSLTGDPLEASFSFFQCLQLLISQIVIIASTVDPHYKELKEFNETNIQTYKYPFGQMVREVLNDSPGSQPVLVFY